MKAEKEVFTAIFQRLKTGGFVGHVEEVTGVVTQADTLEEAKSSLVEALIAMKEVKDEMGEPLKDSDYIVETISL